MGPEAILCFLSVLDRSGLQGPFTEGVVKVGVALTHQRVALPEFLRRPGNNSQTVKNCVSVTENTFSNTGLQYCSVALKLLKTHQCDDLLHMLKDIYLKNAVVLKPCLTLKKN